MLLHPYNPRIGKGVAGGGVNLPQMRFFQLHLFAFYVEVRRIFPQPRGHKVSDAVRSIRKFSGWSNKIDFIIKIRDFFNILCAMLQFSSKFSVWQFPFHVHSI